MSLLASIIVGSIVGTAICISVCTCIDILARRKVWIEKTDLRISALENEIDYLKHPEKYADEQKENGYTQNERSSNT